MSEPFRVKTWGFCLKKKDQENDVDHVPCGNLEIQKVSHEVNLWALSLENHLEIREDNMEAHFE